MSACWLKHSHNFLTPVEERWGILMLTNRLESMLRKAKEYDLKKLSTVNKPIKGASIVN